MKKIIMGISLILASITDGNCNPRPLVNQEQNDQNIMVLDVRNELVKSRIQQIVFSIHSIIGQAPDRIDANKSIREILKGDKTSLESLYKLINEHCRSMDDLRHTTLRDLSKCILDNFNSSLPIHKVALEQLRSLPIA